MTKLPVRYSGRWIRALVALAMLTTGTASLAGTDPSAPLGANLNAVNDFSDEFPFVNLMKSARDWIPGNVNGCFDCREPGGNPACLAPNSCPVTISVDADGYPTSLAPGQVLTSILHAGGNPGRLASGTYTIRFAGNGTLQLLGMTQVSQGSGEIIANLVSSSGNNIGLRLTATTPGDHLRSVEVLPPGGVCSNDERQFCDGSNACAGGASCLLFTAPGVADAQLFQPRFLRNYEPFRLLRYMDWMETNSSPIVDFADYPTPSSAFWHRVPPQILAALGNRLRSDIWINLPHRASDAFIDSFATVLRDSFTPDRRIYLEYSNENWNGIFAQNVEIPRQFCPGFADLAAGCQNDGIPGNGIACERDPNTFSLGAAQAPCFEALVRAWGDRSVQIFDRFAAVFGASANSRLLRVVAAQAANPDLGRQVLARNATGQAFSVASRTDAYASAPYIGTEYCTPDSGINPDTSPQVYASVDNFLDHLETAGMSRAVGFMSGSRAMVNGNFPGLRHIAYEGGQHLAGIAGFTFNNVCNDVFDAANRHPRMETIYETYWSNWRQNGDEFAHFYTTGRYGPFGRWGLLEFQDQDRLSAPKYRALLDHSAAFPCHWSGCTQGGGGGNNNPLLSYAPTAGSQASPGNGPNFPGGTAGTAAASIGISASGASGTGSTMLSGCAVSGSGASAFAAIQLTPANGLFDTGVSSGSIGLACTRAEAPAQALLSCSETPLGGAAITRAWTLTCPPAVVQPDALFDDGFEAGVVSTCTPADVLIDGGLEASNPNTGANAAWPSTSTAFGTAICHANFCPDDAGTAPPRSGAFWAWFGGVNGSETSTLSQTVVLPAGAPRHLNFFLRTGRVTAPFDAQLRVKVDGNVVRVFAEPSTAEPSYVARSVDLSAFANGQSHDIQFEYVNPNGSGVSNFVVDDLSVTCSAVGN
ncbi:MAG: hypothetical protein R3F15_04090 [Lysobacterales bacterium]